MLYGLNAESEAGSSVSHCISAEKWKYLSERLVQCVREKIGFEKSNATSIVILSVRLMVSPPGSKAQPWHLDYSGTSANCQSVFVNISKSVEGNCTEYVEFESSEDEVKCIERARAALLKSGKQGKDWCRKKETKHSIVLLLRLVSFFLHQSLFSSNKQQIFVFSILNTKKGLKTKEFIRSRSIS